MRRIVEKSSTTITVKFLYATGFDP